MRVTVHTAHTVPDRRAIQVHVGQDVAVGERDDDWPEFVYVTTPRGSGWVPARHLTITSDGRAIVDTAYDTTELATRVGETLDVLAEDHQSGWHWCRNHNGSQDGSPPAPSGRCRNTADKSRADKARHIGSRTTTLSGEHGTKPWRQPP